MKYIKLKFEHARLIKEKPLKNMLGSNRFYYPINNLHVYNSVCVLLDRTPKPQLRETNDKFLPIFDDVLNAVQEGYINIKLISDSENLTTIKKDWNANTVSAKQYTWKDCGYVTGTLLPIFIFHVAKILGKTEAKIKEMGFDEVIITIQSMGTLSDNGEIIYTNEKIKELIAWCKLNSSTPLSNYIENKQISSRPTGFGKRVNRGIVNTDKYSGLIYIPFTDELFKELIQHTKGFSNILDGGVVTIIGYDEINEDEFTGFIPIKDLNNIRKFDVLTNGVVWSNTIFKDIKSSSLIEDINAIIKKTGISIEDNQKDYDEMFKKINKVDFDMNKIGEIAYKVNHFIEQSINKQYK